MIPPQASAKALASGQSSASTSLAPSGATTPTGGMGHKLSLQGLAKREQARRQLMSNFRRGATIQMGPTPDELAKDKATAVNSDKSKPPKASRSRSDKKEKKQAKAAKKEAKAQKRTDKAAKKARKAEKEARRTAKRERKAAKGAKKDKEAANKARRTSKDVTKS